MLTIYLENGSSVQFAACEQETVLQALQRAGLVCDAPCGGNGTCGKCRVRWLGGEIAYEQNPLLSDEELADGWRLACRTRALADARFFLPAQTVKAELNVDIDECSGQNRFVIESITLAQPSVGDPRDDSERLCAAVRKTLGYEPMLSLFALRRLPEVLRQADFSVQLLGHLENGIFEIFDLRPQTDEAHIYALAIDIGTTTVCGLLCDVRSGKILAKASLANAQLCYGADVIHRIIEQGRPGGNERLQRAIVHQTLVPLIEALCQKGGISNHEILTASIAANTTMLHLLLGLSAEPLRTEPYTPVALRFPTIRANELALPLHPSAQLRFAPCIGSYVGGDITAGTLVSGLCQEEALALLIDLGTNGEIVLGNREFTVACACSAGPAFEGGDISCGMRAADGAIESVVIDTDGRLRLSVIGGGKPKGLCGSGLIDAVAQLFLRGIVNAKGVFVKDGARVVRDEFGGRYILATADESFYNHEICLTAADIDCFIRAKAAIYSAIDTLLSAMELSRDALQRVYIAGGIGGGINIENAKAVGMLPNLPSERFCYVGNTALKGTYLTAICDGAEQQLHELACGMTYLELSTQRQYMDRFVAACFLPHTDAAEFA
ncbi:MAG: DUF4445 domain-containing protein [Ruminococcaceae bacterium]|nr:DUF4445 domain-containing protein [Oscillospiraceae bacterium]